MRTPHWLAVIGALALGVLATVAVVPNALAATTDPTPTTNIVGGTPANNFHGAVSIQVGGRHYCGGSLILARVVVTAAHCGVIVIPGQTQVRAGSTATASGGQVAGVTAAYPHPDFTGEYGGGDLLIVHLDRPITAMRPIPLASTSGGPGASTLIAGWGRTCQTAGDPACAGPSPTLNQLRTKLMPASACRMPHPETGVDIFNPAHELCTRSADGEPRMACNGDSGGPQTMTQFGREYLIGATSRDGDDLAPHVNDCSTGPDGVTAGLGVWTDLTTYRPWIFQQATRGNRSAVLEWILVHGPVPLS